MAGWFYLSCGRGHHAHLLGKAEGEDDEVRDRGAINSSTVGNKGFELWPQMYTPFGAGLSVNGRSNSNNNNVSSGLGRAATTGLIDFSDDCRRSLDGSVRRGGDLRSGMNCQDCGNQAKKDCAYLRCRTCCRSRGFQCQTHIKSTWVPAAKRRERMQQQEQFQFIEHPKRQREDPPHQQPLSVRPPSGLEVAKQFPAELSSPAVFRCVRVSGTDDDANEEFAYQTSVNISGHVFKGVLYDHGPESRHTTVGASEDSSVGGGAEQVNLVAGSAVAMNPEAPVISSGLTTINPSLYQAPLNAFMAGMQLFPPPRSSN